MVLTLRFEEIEFDRMSKELIARIWLLGDSKAERRLGFPVDQVADARLLEVRADPEDPCRMLIRPSGRFQEMLAALG